MLSPTLFSKRKTNRLTSSARLNYWPLFINRIPWRQFYCCGWLYSLTDINCYLGVKSIDVRSKIGWAIMINVDVRIKQGEIVTGRPCGPIAQWSEYSHGLREVLGSSPVGPCAFSSPVTFGGSVWVLARAASSKGTVSSVPAWFRADSGTNLIKQGEIVTGRPCGPIAQWSEYSHGLREVLGSSPGRAMCFFLPCDIKMYFRFLKSSEGNNLSAGFWFEFK